MTLSRRDTPSGCLRAEPRCSLTRKRRENCRTPYTKDGDFFFSSRRRHTRWNCDWSSDVCSSDLHPHPFPAAPPETLICQMGIAFATDSQKSYGLRLAGAPKHVSAADRSKSSISKGYRSEERRVGKECRCRGSA